jgi:hypothetical protein
VVFQSVSARTGHVDDVDPYGNAHVSPLPFRIGFGTPKLYHQAFIRGQNIRHIPKHPVRSGGSPAQSLRAIARSRCPAGVSGKASTMRRTSAVSNGAFVFCAVSSVRRMPFSVSLTAGCGIVAVEGCRAMVCALVIAVNRRVIVAGRCVVADAVRYMATVSGLAGRGQSVCCAHHR